MWEKSLSWEWSLQLLIPYKILNLRLRGGSSVGSETAVPIPIPFIVYYVSGTVLDIFIYYFI